MRQSCLLHSLKARLLHSVTDQSSILIFVLQFSCDYPIETFGNKNFSYTTSCEFTPNSTNWWVFIVFWHWTLISICTMVIISANRCCQKNFVKSTVLQQIKRFAKIEKDDEEIYKQLTKKYEELSDATTETVNAEMNRNMLLPTVDKNVRRRHSR